jgi:hypothetical protein
MSDLNAKRNKAIVLKAFDTLFNQRDYTAAERFWSPNYNSTQRPYRAGTRRTLQPRQSRAAVA